MAKLETGYHGLQPWLQPNAAPRLIPAQFHFINRFVTSCHIRSSERIRSQQKPRSLSAKSCFQRALISRFSRHCGGYHAYGSVWASSNFQVGRMTFFWTDHAIFKGSLRRHFLDGAATPPCGRARRGITLDSNLFTASMTARISLNLGRTGGHRPPLQSEHFLPLGKAATFARRGIRMLYFPTRCSASFSFSQTLSINSLSGNNSNGIATFQGFVYAFGSSIVISKSMCPKSRRRKRSIA